ncbi:MAG: SDR family NAD(P)-dependent oxidoreductase [Beijerinckiaceae bacterium]
MKPLGVQSLSAQEAAVIGASCMLPGAASLDDFWTLLCERRVATRSAPEGRWSIERYLRPGSPEPGFAYTFAGGYLDDPFRFDPAAFGVSPREAQQIDPQQRMLLELVWRAFEDAGIAPSSVRGGAVGVYVGASNVDHMSYAVHDAATVESHFMTGNSLSILSNRISYVYDLRGPSLTIDTACSSSFAALDHALASLRAGVIDMAIVAGVNLLLSPIPFIGFSQARMLSPTGRCRPFSRMADGYVRAEGGVAMILRRRKDAIANGERIRTTILGSAVNTDGRTAGISLPSSAGQRSVIESLYDALEIDPNDIAFIEAHGTGTAVGDPIEATAIGEALARKRTSPLPIGSVKANVGHLESASGLVGLLKAALSLERGVLPPTAIADELNPAIDFTTLNLNVVRDAVNLPGDRSRIVAGVCNYGFGGVNCHVALRPETMANSIQERVRAPRMLVVSAATEESLVARARQISQTIEGGGEPGLIAAGLGHQRDLMAWRLALPLPSGAGKGSIAARLDAFASGDPANVATGVCDGAIQPVFVYSGNGSQFVGMGRAAFAASDNFQAEIEDIDALFAPKAGWSLAAAIKNGVEPEGLAMTSVAQPLIFAIQSALTATLARWGIRPAFVIGHSVGEIAAAEASGALTRADAVCVIHERSCVQEAVRGLGRMLVVAADAGATQLQISEAGLPAVEIAAINGPASTTVAGPAEDLRAFARHCRRQRIATVALDIDYPFHSSALDPLGPEIRKRLATVDPGASAVSFISTVTAGVVAGADLDANYWWRNLRAPVQFDGAVTCARSLGGNLFVEIGPRPLLVSVLADALRARGSHAKALSAFSGKDDPDLDPCGEAAARLIANGCRFDHEAAFGANPKRLVPLPPYPFQHERYQLTPTEEARPDIGLLEAPPRHPLLGARMASGAGEWRSLVDPVLLPYLTDHRVDAGVVVPAAALADAALAVGAEVFGDVALELDDFDISKALAFAPGETREVSTRFTEATSVVEIRSRRRFAREGWTLHARGVLRRGSPDRTEPPAPPAPEHATVAETEAIYAAARRAGLEYGPLFRVVKRLEYDNVAGVSSLAGSGGSLRCGADRHVLDPIALDAAFHGLFLSRPQRDGETIAHLPVRFRKLRIWRHGAQPVRAVTRLTRETARYKTVVIALLDAEGAVVASIEAAVLRAVVLSRAVVSERTFAQDAVSLSPFNSAAVLDAVRRGIREAGAAPRAWLLMRAFALSLAHRLVTDLMGECAAPDIHAARAWINSPEGRDYFDVLVTMLEERGALIDTPSGPAPSADPGAPSPEALLATLLRAFPEAAADAQLAAAACEQAPRLLREGEALAPPASVRAFEAFGARAAAISKRMENVLAFAAQAAGRRLRILVLEPFGAAVWRALTPLAAAGAIEVTCAAAQASALRSARAIAPPGVNCAWLDLSDAVESGPAAFDGLVCLALTEPETGGLADILPAAVSRLAPQAPIIVAAAGCEPALDVLRGVWRGWLDAGVAGFPAGRVPSAETVMRALGNCARVIERQSLGDGLGSLVTAVAAPARQDVDGAGPVYAAVAGDHGVRADVLASLGLADVRRITLSDFESALKTARTPAGATVLLAPDAGAGAPAERLARRIEDIRGVLLAAASAAPSPRIVVVTASAGMSGDPVETAVYCFARTAVNEFPAIDLRIVDVMKDARDAVKAGALKRVLQEGRGEREFRVDANGVSAMRIYRDAHPEAALGEDERSALAFALPGRVESFEWTREHRREPGPGEIEIEVSAVGLNFRDVLVGLGALDDDLLAAGLTGASLGFECSGVVVRAGAGVLARAGDRVMGFAAGAFASHVTAPADQFFPVPDGVSLEAAATIPVAFATAWHSLMERARLTCGEDALIHGGAGGLGMAAIQIAKLAGARVVATAGSPARRAVARATGADLVFDSRGERFADSIAASLGGVDVALNSISGAAMLETFRLVKPFGRFIEVGKRDYLDNTHLALRPFVRNITYAGVDLDELLAHDRGAAARIMDVLRPRFEAGELRPLPHQIFEPHEIVQAFRAMQASEHIGKIVVRPSRRARPAHERAGFRPRAGAWLIVGGTSGLGFATAEWLARKGVRTLILASRRGAVEDALDDALGAMRRAGVQVRLESLDVGDAAAVASLVGRIELECGPLRGVVHAAAHLDDGLIAGLEPQRLHAVLRVKVDGAENLDRATASSDLDAFVLYSSATTLIGSPGQSAYVAANAYLEGLARRRRAQGRPAVAIAWGAISDVGMIARDAGLGERLRRTTGVAGIRSSDALAYLDGALAAGRDAEPVLIYSNIAASSAAGKLALLTSPAFAALEATNSEAAQDGSENIMAAIASMSRPDALAHIARALRREVAQILRMPESQVETSRPLGQMGFDSLMALELQLAFERLSGMQLPLVGTSERTLSELAANILQMTQAANEPDSSAARQTSIETEIVSLARRHAAPAAANEDGRALLRGSAT